MEWYEALHQASQVLAQAFDGLWFTLGIGFGILLGELIRKLEE